MNKTPRKGRKRPMAAVSGGDAPLDLDREKFPRWMNTFVRAYARSGVIHTALRETKISISTLRKFRASVPEFDEAVREAGEEATDGMEQEAWRRATEGVERPVYQRGVLVGSYREYSDALLIFLLRARRPEKYRESRGIGVKTPDGTQMIVFDTGIGVDIPWGNRDALPPKMEEEPDAGDES